MTPAKNVDRLAQRYDDDGRRYVCYPFAERFHAGFDAVAYRRSALLSNVRAAPLAVYVHIPFCASACSFCGDPRVITCDPQRAHAYVQRLKREISMQARLFDSHRPIEHLHFGGGTPTFLTPSQLGDVLSHLGHHFRLTLGRDALIEIDPRTFRVEELTPLAAIGFDRINLGVQDFDEAVQKAIHRIQPPQRVLAIVERARAIGFKSIGVDLICGLPLQTLERFARTLDTAIAARPDRLAVYRYMHRPAVFKAQRRIVSEQLPSPSTRRDLLALATEKLTGAGYEPIGPDHFALPEDDLARAQRAGRLRPCSGGYSTHGDCDLMGLGVSAVSRVGSAYAQNHHRLTDYNRAIDADTFPIERGYALTIDDETRREVIEGLLCHGQVTVGDVEARYAITFERYFARELKQLEALIRAGMLSRNEHEIRITPQGRLFLRHIALCFAAPIAEKRTLKYSRAR